MIARIDSAPDVIPAGALRQRLSDGEHIDKRLIVRSATVDLLTTCDLAEASRDRLVHAVFDHTSMWVTFAGNTAGRRLPYRRLTTEQVALILIYRHRARSAPASAVPDDWNHTGSQRSAQRVAAVWIDREHGRRRQIPDELTPGFFTWPIEIDALSHRYRPSASGTDCARIRGLLTRWAPDHTLPSTTR